MCCVCVFLFFFPEFCSWKLVVYIIHKSILYKTNNVIYFHMTSKQCYLLVPAYFSGLAIDIWNMFVLMNLIITWILSYKPLFTLIGMRFSLLLWRNGCNLKVFGHWTLALLIMYPIIEGKVCFLTIRSYFQFLYCTYWKAF